jgi:KUP system potassium uptake protein
VILATLATIIASQAIITGAYSLTRQGIQLGWLPPVRVTQTSAEGYGQIYVGTVNWLLMAVTIGLTLLFKRSDALASAYGIAVSLTMALTTVLLFVAMRRVLGWPSLVAGAVGTAFLIVDLAFVAANLVKIAEGGYVPLAIAAAVFGLMWIWHRGSAAVADYVRTQSTPLAGFVDTDLTRDLARVPGTAVFLSKATKETPPLLHWHVSLNKALQENVVVLTVQIESVPFVAASERLSLEEVAPGIWRAEAEYGFMDDVDIPALLETAQGKGCHLELDDLTFYVGHAAIVARDDRNGMPRWMVAIFAALQRNALHLGDVLRLPPERTIELGRQIAV